MVSIGEHLIDLEEFEKSKQLLSQGLALRKTLAPNKWNTHYCELLIGISSLGAGDVLAIENIEIGFEKFRKAEDLDSERKSELTIVTAERLVSIFRRLGESESVERWQRVLDELQSGPAVEQTNWQGKIP